VSALIEYRGETYLTASEVAARFKISRGTCYHNILQQMKACYLPGRKNALYRQSEVEQFSEVRVVVACQQSVSSPPSKNHALPSPLTIKYDCVGASILPEYPHVGQPEQLLV
jgi:hypothetical protein